MPAEAPLPSSSRPGVIAWPGRRWPVVTSHRLCVRRAVHRSAAPYGARLVPPAPIWRWCTALTRPAPSPWPSPPSTAGIALSAGGGCRTGGRSGPLPRPRPPRCRARWPTVAGHHLGTGLARRVRLVPRRLRPPSARASKRVLARLSTPCCGRAAMAVYHAGSLCGAGQREGRPRYATPPAIPLGSHERAGSRSRPRRRDSHVTDVHPQLISESGGILRVPSDPPRRFQHDRSTIPAGRLARPSGRAGPSPSYLL